MIKYKKNVVEDNLERSFPLKTKKELKVIRKRFYKNFSDFIVETLKFLTISQRQLEKRVQLSDSTNEELKSRFKNKENIIALSGHIFNWEYCSFLASKVDYKVIISYKKLKNSFWEGVIKTMRQRFGGITVDFRKTYISLLRRKKKGDLTITWICGDQMPNWDKNTLTEEIFLNQKTYFFNGINELARRTDSTVYFVDLRKKPKSVYEIDFKLITDKPNEHSTTFITKKYSELLEDLILQDPSNWLWSHRRWKKVPNKT